MASAANSVSNPCTSQEGAARTALCCAILTTATLLVINSLAWAGIMSTQATAITNLSLIGMRGLTAINFIARVDGCSNRSTLIALIANLAIGGVINGLALAGIIPGEVLGQAYVAVAVINLFAICRAIPRETSI